MKVNVIDYGMGNVGSILNMLKKIGVAAERVSNPADIFNADRVILPGVGSFDNAIIKLEDLGFADQIRNIENHPNCQFLGICLGMQLMASRSDEGVKKGLNLIPGKVTKFNLPETYKIPHMGWNSVEPVNSNPLLNGLGINKFYFVHSYFYQPDNSLHTIGETNFHDNFTCMIHRDNIWGAQFHPEKSHKYGMALLQNFVDLK